MPKQHCTTSRSPNPGTSDPRRAPQARHLERKQHVDLLPTPVTIASLRLGDAVVAFSRRDVLMLRDRIAASGHPVSVIYGALPPEVRRREAERFAQGESHILVATDAIGMGLNLNLPIQRVVFSTLTKYDGVADRTLDESEVHQIAGRAGRYGIHEEGFVGVLDEAEPTALRVLKELLAKTPRAPADFKAPVAPNGWHVDTISVRLGEDRLFKRPFSFPTAPRTRQNNGRTTVGYSARSA